MLILHAAFSEDRLFVWGEIPAAADLPLRRERKRKSKAAKPSPLPYDAGQEKLSAALEEAGLGHGLRDLAGQPAVAWLPTRKNRPLASSPLIAESSASPEAFKLSPWQVTALTMPTAGEIELLCACVSQELLAPGIVIGQDLAFWAQTLRFAGSLAARHRFLPGLQEIQGTYRARWEPVLTGTDSDTAARLAGLMPRVGRSLTLDAISPPKHPAAPTVPGPDRLEDAEPVPEDLLEPATFWGGEDIPGDLFGEVRVPEVVAALPKRLGSFPFWRGRVQFLEALEPFYLKAASQGLDTFLGLTKDPAEEAAAPDKPITQPSQSGKILQGKFPTTRRQTKKPISKKKSRRKPRSK